MTIPRGLSMLSALLIVLALAWFLSREKAPGSILVAETPPGASGPPSSSETADPGGRMIPAGSEAAIHLLVLVRHGDEVIPLPGARVTARGRLAGPRKETVSAPTAVHAFTDRRGEVFLRGLPPRPHDIRVRAPGCLGREVVVTAVPEPEEPTRVILPELARILGHVADRSGRPVADALVKLAGGRRASRPLEGAGYPEPSRLRRLALEGFHESDLQDRDLFTTRTDADGAFALTGIPPGERFVVVASHAEAGLVEEEVEAPEPGETLVLRLVMKGMTGVRGRVRGDPPAPGERVSARIYHVTAEGHGWVHERTIGDVPALSFFFGNVLPGRKLVVTVRRAPGSLTFGFAEGLLHEEETLDLGEIPVHSGRLGMIPVLEDPEQDVAIQVRGTVARPGPPVSLHPFAFELDPKRELEVIGLPEGRLHLHAWLARREESHVPLSEWNMVRRVVGLDGGSETLELRFCKQDPRKSGELEVRLSPPPGMQIEDLRPFAGAFVAGRLVKALFDAPRGLHSVRLRGLPPGSCDLCLVAGEWIAWVRDVRVAGGRTSRVEDLPWRRSEALRGTLRGPGGAPREGLRILLAQQTDVAGVPRPMVGTRSDAQGRWVLEAVPEVPDRVLIVETEEGHELLRAPLEVRQRAIDLVLPR